MITCLLLISGGLAAQELHEYKDSVVLSTPSVRCTANLRDGKITYRYADGSYLENTVAYVEDVNEGKIASSDFAMHSYELGQVRDDLGMGIKLTFRHTDDKHKIVLEQQVTLYPELDYLLLRVVAQQQGIQRVVTRNISPLAVLPAYGGKYRIAGSAPRILDVPFDNDNWTDIV